MSTLLSFTGGLYVIFAFSVCWMAYAKAWPPVSARPTGGPKIETFAAVQGTGQITRATKPPATPAQNVSPATAALERSLEAEETKLELDRQELELQQKYLEERSKDVDKRADDLEHLIAEMTIGSSGYTLLLGLFAFFGLKGAATEADRYLGTLDKQVESFKVTAQADLEKVREENKTERAARNQEFQEFREELKHDVPSLYGMQRALNILLERIRRQVDMSQIWTLSDPYNNMSEEQRQRLVLAEMTVAAFDYFRLDSSQLQRKVAGQIFADLANFYSARARMNPARYDASDMHRAIIYFDRAHRMDPENARILAQRGGFVLSNRAKQGDPVTEDQLDEAEHDLRECLRLDPSDVRGLYNLAWIADERKKYAEAVDLLTQIIVQRDTLPRSERGRRMIWAFVNRACARAKLRESSAGAAEGESMDEKIIRDCKDACEEANLYNEKAYVKNSLERELGATGDLRHLATMPEMKALIAEPEV